MQDQTNTPNLTASQPEIEQIPTGIASPDMYRMSKWFAAQVSDLGLSLNGHRVLHALLHQTCRDLPGWSADVIQPDGCYLRACVDIRATLGLLQAKGNRDLVDGVTDLRNRGIFEHLGLRHDNHWISWRFEDDVLAGILDGDTYGLLDATALRHQKSTVGFNILTRISVVRRMRRARLDLTVGEVAAWKGRKDVRWSDVRSDLIAAIRLVCAHYDMTAVMVLSCRGSQRGIDTIKLRLRCTGSLWSAVDIAKTEGTPRQVIVIDGSGFRDVRKNGLPDFVARLRAAKWRLGGMA